MPGTVTEEIVAAEVKKRPQRLIIKDMIDAGGATRDSIKTALNITPATLATNFSYLKMGGFYTITDEDGILGFTDEDGWDKLVAEKAANKKPAASKKTLPEQHLALTNKLAKCKIAAEKAETLAKSAEDNRLLDLRFYAADTAKEIAGILLAEFEKANDAEAYAQPAPVVDEEVAEDVVESEELPDDTEEADELL